MNFNIIWAGMNFTFFLVFLGFSIATSANALCVIPNGLITIGYLVAILRGLST